MASQPVEFDAFAACLRTFKERAQLSYEALARESGISSSSLHRYCSGSYVPQDYGPVHRFATACGASPEELRRLHRLWALADARREPDRHSDSDSDPSLSADGDTEQEQPAIAAAAAVLPPARRHVRRFVCSAAVLALVLGATAWALMAMSRSGPAVGSGPTLVRTSDGQSVAPVHDTSWSPMSAAADCPEPGNRFKTFTHDRVYLVGPGRRLYFIPNPTVYFDLWDTWNEIATVPSSVFADCDWPTAYELADAFLARTDSSTQLYIWDTWSGFRPITSTAVFAAYGFSRSKIQTRDVLSPISRSGWQ